MQAQVRKWENSQEIRFSKPFHHRTLEERAAEYDDKLNLDGEYDWGEPVGRERWQ